MLANQQLQVYTQASHDMRVPLNAPTLLPVGRRHKEKGNIINAHITRWNVRLWLASTHLFILTCANVLYICASVALHFNLNIIRCAIIALFRFVCFSAEKYMEPSDIWYIPYILILKKVCFKKVCVAKNVAVRGQKTKIFAAKQKKRTKKKFNWKFFSHLYAVAYSCMPYELAVFACNICSCCMHNPNPYHLTILTCMHINLHT